MVIVAHADLGLEPRGQLDEFHGGPDVQAEAVEDHDLAMGDRRIVAHRQLDRPGPGTSDRRVGSSGTPGRPGIALEIVGPPSVASPTVVANPRSSVLRHRFAGPDGPPRADRPSR